MSDWRQSTPLGRPVVPPVQIMSRSSGDAVTFWSVFPCESASSKDTASDSSGAALSSSTDSSRSALSGGNTSGDFEPCVVVVDIHRNGAGLEALDDHAGVGVVVHDERNAVLSAFPIL